MDDYIEFTLKDFEKMLRSKYLYYHSRSKTVCGNTIPLRYKQNSAHIKCSEIYMLVQFGTGTPAAKCDVAVTRCHIFHLE